jgi:hypothetical protein
VSFEIIAILLFLNLLLIIFFWRVNSFNLDEKNSSDLPWQNLSITKKICFLFVVFFISLAITSTIFFGDLEQKKERNINENQQIKTSQFSNIYQIKQQRIRTKIKDSFFIEKISEITLICLSSLIFIIIWQSQKKHEDL